jgi:hypothetical protein
LNFHIGANTNSKVANTKISSRTLAKYSIRTPDIGANANSKMANTKIILSLSLAAGFLQQYCL